MFGEKFASFAPRTIKILNTDLNVVDRPESLQPISFLFVFFFFFSEAAGDDV